MQLQWKEARTKQYKLYFCIPPVGTRILDKVRYKKIYDIVKKEFFTNRDVSDIKHKNDRLCKVIVENTIITSKQNPVVTIDLLGNYKTMSFKLLHSLYRMQDGKEINAELMASLMKKMGM